MYKRQLKESEEKTQTNRHKLTLGSMADRKIDVHSHFVPTFYRDALLEHGITNPDGMPGIPDWSPESHLDFMNVCLLSCVAQIDLLHDPSLRKRPTLSVMN